MRQALTLGGALVGAYFGQPQLGFIIGSLLGNAVDPVKVYGPRLTDSKVQTARDGVPINWGLGRFRCAGTVIACQPDGPTEHEETDGGKGGPEEVTYRYTYTFAVLVCEGPVNGIARIWADQKIIYNVSPLPDDEDLIPAAIAGVAASSKVAEGMTLYLGTEDQLPDPELEAIFGVGNVPAHRGSVIAVFKDYDVTERGGSLPNLEFEVTTTGSTTDLCNSPSFFPINVRSTFDGAIDFPTLIAGLKGQHVTGLNPAQSLFLVPRSIADGGDFTSWSPYEDDGDGIFPYLWAATLQVTREGSFATTQYNDTGGTQGIVDGLVETSADAFNAASPITLSGSTGYWLWIKDEPVDDNRGGLSYWAYIGTPVPGAPGWAVDSDGNYFNYDGTCSTLVGTEQITLAEVLTEISLRSGLTEDDIDVSECGDLLDGFLVARESQGDSLITLLQPPFFFDACEVDGVVKFVKRGGASAVTVDADDLVAREGPPVEETRDQEIERPRKVNVVYFDPEVQYIPTKQTAERRASVAAIGERSLELPVVIPKDTAAQIADKLIKISWTDLLGSVGLSLPDEFSYLVPTDIVTLSYRDRVQRLRIERLDEESGQLMLQCRQDRLSAYDSTATGIGTPVNSYPVPLGPTDLVAMNLPRLRDQDVTAGLYLAACGLTAGWPGCMVQISFDDGATFANAVAINTASVLGYLTADALAADTALDVVVTGSISSASDDQIAAGANAFAVISSDVSEVVQAKTATPGGGGEYALTDVTRGLKGTTAADHDEHDRFVGLNRVTFLPVDSAFAGRTLYLRAVTNGTSADEAPVISIVFDPQFTEPESVSFLLAESGAKLMAEDDAFLQLE